ALAEETDAVNRRDFDAEEEERRGSRDGAERQEEPRPPPREEKQQEEPRDAPERNRNPQEHRPAGQRDGRTIEARSDGAEARRGRLRVRPKMHELERARRQSADGRQQSRQPSTDHTSLVFAHVGFVMYPTNFAWAVIVPLTLDVTSARALPAATNAGTT